jgi:hypothetical protein
VPSHPDAAFLAVEPPGLESGLANLSTTLVDCPTDAIADQVSAVVDWTARGLDVDRVGLAQRVPQGSGRVRVTLEWAREGFLPSIGWLAFGTVRGRQPGSPR